MIENHTVQTMGSIFAGIFGALFVTWQPLVRVAQGSCLPVPKTHPSKRAGEIFVLYYSICWILAVGTIHVYSWMRESESREISSVCGIAP